MNPEVQITEDDEDAKAYMREIARVRHADVTLGQVIHGLLWELSFHGGPREKQEVVDEVDRRVAEIDAGTTELVSGDGIFESLNRTGCDALFDDLGGRSPREIATAIREIEDNESAAAWLDNAFHGKVLVKPKFRNGTGRDFRKAFRAARR